MTTEKRIEPTAKATRKYEKRRRAESEEETRRRITVAAMKLHGTLGPARTTIKSVAIEAGVQRATVYRHFPDLERLFIACSTHWSSLNPPPDPETWTQIPDPDVRLREGLSQLYAWYGWAEPMITKVLRDAPSVPAMNGPVQAFGRQMLALHGALMSGRNPTPAASRRVNAAIGHATAYSTWNSLVRQHGLAPPEAVELMSELVSVASSGKARRLR
jgi:AcrR family transcriptional regulator